MDEGVTDADLTAEKKTIEQTTTFVLKANMINQEESPKSHSKPEDRASLAPTTSTEKALSNNEIPTVKAALNAFCYSKTERKIT